MAGILHVRVTTPYEAECAEAGGADRIVLTATAPDTTIPPDMVAKVRQASSLHLRVRLRLRPDFTTDGAEMTRLKGLAFTYSMAGADGFLFGFLNAMTGIDRQACDELASDATWHWTLDRAIDSALDQDEAWQTVPQLPRVDSVLTAGSARGVEHGLDALIARHDFDPPIIAGGSLLAEHIPWLVRGGLRQFFVDSGPVSTEHVRAWRNLIDSEVARQA